MSREPRERRIVKKLLCLVTDQLFEHKILSMTVYNKRLSQTSTAKTNDKRQQRFGAFMTPLSMAFSLRIYANNHL